MTSDQSRIPTPTEEARLVGRDVQLDPDAYLRLSEAYLDRIYRHIYCQVISTSEGDDLTDYVFLKGREAIKRDDPRGKPFGVWLYRLTHTLVVDQDRVQQVSTPRDDAAVKGTLVAAEVRAALVALSPEHQQLIVLRLVEGLSHAEVSQIIGKSEGATRLIQHRALQEFGRLLAALGTT